ncbi:hypothetical protein E5161_00005 [Cohnella pontilimi]|uniref:DUF2867 domain-containing protein n=1 Tax=Cohnella pontilimi TaxID=2564100 RepID=A0A4U0FG05_9BACL|nr:hypothetical protein [Cohnella pontilimi]TJY43835.1 hypothetical protein E5161_00005 [Cohnella pontilimi]
MKLIDKYLPRWDFAKCNQILLNNKEIPENSIMNHVDFGKSRIIRFLFFLRGLSTKKLNFDKALRAGFILLDQNKSEIVLGLIAQPWKLKGNIIHTTPSGFSEFDQSDFIKAAWNFRYEKKQDGLYLTTETRIHCTSKNAHKKFSIYWSFIGFFSGVIRNAMLKIIKSELSKDLV